MKKNSTQKLLSFIVCMVLIAAMALCMSGCNGTNSPTEPTVFSDGQSLGSGAVTFTFTVEDLDGSKATAQISTDKELVGEALQELGVIQGEEAQYGLYIKTVNGITYDYAKDGAYWSFYVDGAYAMAGVDSTQITPGAAYTLKAEKA